jgi:uncharacterized protein (DUF362 family)
MKVAVAHHISKYNDNRAFSPYHEYPEYPFDTSYLNHSSEKETTTYDSYAAVRDVFVRLGMDTRNYGTKSWNPLGDLIKPGEEVLLKPNFVLHTNRASLGTEQMVTHGSIIRAALDYVSIALNLKGIVTIADSPVQSCNFRKAIQISGIDQILDFFAEYSDLEVNLVDLRASEFVPRRLGGYRARRLPGDERGYTLIDLKDASEHAASIGGCETLRVTNYQTEAMLKHHNKDKHEYEIPNTVLEADVIINLPKLKTHVLAGMTCSLKNSIGACGSKAYLPHYRVGASEEGGDEYPSESTRKRLMSRLSEELNNSRGMVSQTVSVMLMLLVQGTMRIHPFSDPHLFGRWHGNDTIPRTIVDVNKLLFYADKSGVLQNHVQRNMLVIVDGVVAGQAEGPLSPQRADCGVIIGGCNPVAIDLVCSKIIGFDYQKIPTLTRALNSKKYQLFGGELRELVIESESTNSINEVHAQFCNKLKPPASWKGYIESNT